MEALRTLLFQVFKLTSLFLFLFFFLIKFNEIKFVMLLSSFSGLIDLAIKRNSLIGGDDFKSGQTKMKSVLVDFLVGAGIKVYK